MAKCKLLYNKNQIEYQGDKEVEIAKVIDLETNKDLIYVDYFKNLFKEEGVHCGIFVFENEDGEYPVARIDDLNRSCLFEQPSIFLSMILHEYGHYINGDLNVTDKTTESIMDERMKYIIAGTVMEQELKADEVSIKLGGKNAFIRFMDYLIRKRRERGDEGMDLAIKEFELRKKAARKI